MARSRTGFPSVHHDSSPVATASARDSGRCDLRHSDLTVKTRIIIGREAKRNRTIYDLYAPPPSLPPSGLL